MKSRNKAMMVPVAAILPATGCTTVKYVPVETIRADSTATAHIRETSVRISDSTEIDRTTDTVKITRWRTETRMQTERDTLWHERVDTVTIETTADGNGKQPTLWTTAGNVSTGICIGLAIALIFRIVIKLRG